MEKAGSYRDYMDYVRSIRGLSIALHVLMYWPLHNWPRDKLQ